MSANSDEFSPISEIFLNKIRDPEIPPWIIYPPTPPSSTSQENNTEFSNSLYSSYNFAADLGISQGSQICYKKFGSQCPFSSRDQLNMPLLKALRILVKKFNLQFSDNDDDEEEE